MTDETAVGAGAADATRGSAIKLAAEVASRLVGLGTTLLLARALGVAEFGAFGRLFYVALVVAELAEFGLQATATRGLVAGSHSLKSLARARLATSGMVAAGAVLALAVAPVLAPLVLFFVLAGWGEFLGVALRCRGARVAEALLLLLLRGGSLAGAAVAILAGAGLPGLAWSQALSPLPALLVGASLLARRPAPPARDAAVGAVLRDAWPLAVNGGLQMLSPRVEFLVLSALAGDRETGIFLAALRVVEFLSMIPNAVVQGAMPALVREALQGGEAVRRRTASTMTLVAAPAAVGLFLVADGVVALLYGADYAPAALPVRLLAVGLVPLYMNVLMSWALLARGRAPWLPRLSALRVGLAFVLALALVPRLGSAGAAGGFAAAECLVLVVAATACRRAGFGVRVVRPVGQALVACLPMGLAVNGVRDSLALAVPVGALTWGATLAAAWGLRQGGRS